MYKASLNPVTFVAGSEGSWEILRVTPIVGTALGLAAKLAVYPSGGLVTTGPLDPRNGEWTLRGVAGQVRYVERLEKGPLDAQSLPLGRPEATKAALIPIRKSEAWWALPQDERRAIFENKSQHIANSMKYLPYIARRLYHSRDLGEPFDFLTWFEFAPQDAAAFEDLVGILRASEEWTFVEHEVEIELAR